MDLFATLRRSGGVDALARRVEVSPAAVSAAVEALLPALLGGLRAYALARGGGSPGIGAMMAMIDDFGDGGLAADVMGPSPLVPTSGEAIIVTLFGDGDARQRLARDVSHVSGQEHAMLEKVAPFLAMLLCGYLSARVKAEGHDGRGLAWLRELLMLDEAGRALGKDGENGE